MKPDRCFSREHLTSDQHNTQMSPKGDCRVMIRENMVMHHARIGEALRSNYLALFTVFTMVLMALFLSYMMISLALSTIKSYHALLPANDDSSRKRKKKGTARSQSLTNDDDVIYPDEIAQAGSASSLHDSDNNRIKASISNMKNKYSQYNAAMLDYASRVQGREADDLMDEQVLSRENDDFVYKNSGDV